MTEVPKIIISVIAPIRDELRKRLMIIIHTNNVVVKNLLKQP